ncbi:hypothetical protein EVAR_89533_1 [Eumeta japonica]|uniref:Uncharacterized protein n=1 Tax=Eumeta variegata TaxID=151549 RepID=A0A4C1Y5L2_EUMVA|nr:hypothetical protein EVAR_89533_1 [Eumeta japonica]
MSYDYIWSLGKSLAPNFMNMFDCIDEDDAWACAREKAGKMLDSWRGEVQKQRRAWQAAADEEVRSSGRSYTELPSKLGQEVESSLTALADLLQHGVAR